MTKLTDDKRVTFLAVLADGGSISQACQRIGISRQSMYANRSDPDFAAAWDEAVDAGIDCLEDEAVRRAKTGSDPVLMFLLRGKRPEVYRDRHSIEHSGGLDLRRAPLEDLRSELSELLANATSVGPTESDPVPGAKGRVRGKPQ